MLIWVIEAEMRIGIALLNSAMKSLSAGLELLHLLEAEKILADEIDNG